MDPAKDNYTNYTAATSVLTVGEVLEIARRFIAETDAFRKKQLRYSAELVEHTTCNVCGRKPTVTVNGYGGETIVVCPHLWEAVRNHATLAKPDCLSSQPSLPFAAVRFEVFDDGPARW